MASTRARAGLSVSVTNQHGRSLRAGGLAGWLKRAAPAGARGTVGVALVPDAAMRRLNRRYRAAGHATDVLSFPAGGRQAPGVEPGARRSSRPTPPSAPFLGDIAIARGVAARQARALGHTVRVELRVLALHGLLHLLGYDHETDRGEMKRLEERLRRRAGLPAGLIGRPAARTRRR